MPIVLSGEGDYSLNAVKDIRVTEEFLGLGEDVIHCQTKEFRPDCLTRKYQEKVLSSCGCAPLSTASYYPAQVLPKLESSLVHIYLSRPLSAPLSSWTVLVGLRWLEMNVWSIVREQSLMLLWRG